MNRLKATNPYSQSENPISWHGWEVGFHSKPNTNVSQSEIAVYGPAFKKAFYRGQGAQTLRNYEPEVVRRGREWNYNTISNPDGV
jgi:hypothetical protein